MPFAILQICVRKELSEKSLSIKYYNSIDSAFKYILNEILIYSREKKHKIIKDNIIDVKYKEILEKYINNNLPVWLKEGNKDGDLIQLIVIENPYDFILDNSTMGVDSIDDLIYLESKNLDEIID